MKHLYFLNHPVVGGGSHTLSWNHSGRWSTCISFSRRVRPLPPPGNPDLEPALRLLDFYEAEVRSRSFLHNQIRRMVGAAAAVAQGKVSEEVIRGFWGSYCNVLVSPILPSLSHKFFLREYQQFSNTKCPHFLGIFVCMYVCMYVFIWVEFMIQYKGSFCFKWQWEMMIICIFFRRMWNAGWRIPPSTWTSWTRRTPGSSRQNPKGCTWYDFFLKKTTFLFIRGISSNRRRWTTLPSASRAPPTTSPNCPCRRRSISNIQRRN